VTAPVLAEQAAAAALDAAQARAATDRLILTLTDAHTQLIDLWRSGAHTALGYGPGVAGWSAYCAAEFGALLNVLPTADQLQAMSAAGMPQRALAAPFGVSLGKVNGLLRRRCNGAAAGPESPASTEAGPTLPTYAVAAATVAAAGAKGLTIPQAQRRLGWTYGAVSGALSRAERKGLVSRPTTLEQRNGYRPYVAPH
jgi:hypothetical protein